MAPLYGDLTTFKQLLSVTDTTRDALLTMALTTASRQVDAYTSRRFYLDTVVSDRYYTPDRREAWYVSGGGILVDDIGSTDGMIVAEGYRPWNGVGATTFTPVTNDVTLRPDNAFAQGRPVTMLVRAIGTIVDPYIQLRVTALWGWPAVPDEIVQATYIQAMRLYRRKDSPEGVLGNSEWGALRVSRVDPDVMALLDPYVKGGFG